MEAAAWLIKGCPEPSDQNAALAAFGLKPEVALEPVAFELWAEHLQAVSVFFAAQSQWAVTPAGILGLRYEALPLLMETSGIDRADWPSVFQDIQVMERHAVEVFRNARG